MGATQGPMKSKTLIVLTGPMAAGKGGLEDWAQEKRIPFISMSKLIEEHAGKDKEELGREGMQEYSNAQRRKHGADLFARETAKRINSNDNEFIIVDGMRNTHEGEYFRSHYQTIVVGIVPPSPEQEFENMQRRDRQGDPNDPQHFEEVRRRELGDGQGEEGQHVDACLRMADATIVNEHGEDGKAQLVGRFEAILRERGIRFEA